MSDSHECPEDGFYDTVVQHCALCADVCTRHLDPPPPICTGPCSGFYRKLLSAAGATALHSSHLTGDDGEMSSYHGTSATADRDTAADIDATTIVIAVVVATVVLIGVVLTVFYLCVCREKARFVVRSRRLMTSQPPASNAATTRLTTLFSNATSANGGGGEHRVGNNNGHSSSLCCEDSSLENV